MQGNTWLFDVQIEICGDNVYCNWWITRVMDITARYFDAGKDTTTEFARRFENDNIFTWLEEVHMTRLFRFQAGNAITVDELQYELEEIRHNMTVVIIHKVLAARVQNIP